MWPFVENREAGAGTGPVRELMQLFLEAIILIILAGRSLCSLHGVDQPGNSS